MKINNTQMSSAAKEQHTPKAIVVSFNNHNKIRNNFANGRLINTLI